MVSCPIWIRFLGLRRDFFFPTPIVISNPSWIRFLSLICFLASLFHYVFFIINTSKKMKM